MFIINCETKLIHRPHTVYGVLVVFHCGFHVSDCQFAILPQSERYTVYVLQEARSFYQSGLRNRVCFRVRFGGFASVTMKNVVFWDIRILFIPHRRHITSPLQSPAS
jgi:hypothetical protein